MWKFSWFSQHRALVHWHHGSALVQPHTNADTRIGQKTTYFEMHWNTVGCKRSPIVNTFWLDANWCELVDYHSYLARLAASHLLFQHMLTRWRIVYIYIYIYRTGMYSSMVLTHERQKELVDIAGRAMRQQGLQSEFLIRNSWSPLFDRQSSLITAFPCISNIYWDHSKICVFRLVFET